MVSKDRQKRQKKKQWDTKNDKKKKRDASRWYVENKHAAIEQAKNRMLSDKIMRKQNIRRVKARLLNDTEYRNINSLRATMKKQRKRIRPESRERELAKMKIRVKKKWNEDRQYREEHRAQMRRHRQMKLQNDKTYRDEHRQKMKMMYKKNPLYHDANRIRAKKRYQHRKCGQCDKKLTDRQKYWLRRSRLLAVSRRRAELLKMQKKMEKESGVSMFNIQLLFKKAEHHIKAATASIKRLHVKVKHTVEECLQYVPTDRSPTEADMVTAFEGQRSHTTTSEPYFWEQSSKPLSVSMAIPIDAAGQAHVYKSIPSHNFKEENSTSETSATRTWECNSDVCSIKKEQIKGTVRLLHSIHSVKPDSVRDFYANVDQCMYETRNDCLGHSVHCTPQSRCDSLLRPARTLSCHFPCLRSVIRRIYDLRRLSLCIQAVTCTMSSGDYKMLEAAIQHLQDAVQQICSVGSSATNNHADPERPLVTEETVLKQYEQSLQETAKSRDTYNTDSCDVCEQLRKDLRSLKSCEKLKGFQSEKMQNIIDLLYQNKTQHEDIDEFLENMKICNYCIDKLRNNKDIHRSIFNRLTVIPTPECITELNVFERTLIKFCMPCVTIIRLGHICNKTRPHNELTSALKGRIAYLPVNVESNAKFLPENLLNIDSLVLLVGGQPTQNNKIWTSQVDLTKVHKALMWLRQHNHLYKEVPAYTVTDLENILRDKMQSTDNSDYSHQDSSLLKKLDDDARSYLYENFSVQPLSSNIPSDVIIDYQLNKVSGQSMNIFDSDLDLKAFPELFPTGENGIKDSLRELKIATTDFIRSRLLNRNPKFRLNINYLFHCFQVQEVSNMCHSIGHMLRSVTGNKLSAKEFHERLENKDGEINSNMFSLMSHMRGSKEYFAKLGMDVKWMMKTLGPPTLFVTCSCAEWFSDSLISYLRSINSSVPGIDTMTPAELCAMDPVNVSIHFHNKWDAIFNKLIRSKEQPLFGKVADYVYRIEYQARGAPHVHAILWIENAPIIGQNTMCEVEEYIRKIITCSKPDKNSSPTLCELVEKFQTHKCNKYCQKTYKRGTKFYKKCRFGFPRPVKSNMCLNDVIDCLAISRQKKPRKRLYHLPRAQTETHVNDYNPALLIANQGNVDVQYIGHLGSRLPYYITDYMTKYERSEQDSMWKDIFTSTKSLGSNAMSFVLQSVKSRQVGANEAADRLLGHKLYSKSRQLRFADLQPADKAKRMLKTADDISKLLKNNPDSSDIFQAHWVLDIYPDRPDELESSSLYEIMSWYEKERVTPGSSKPLQLQHLPYYLRRRKASPYIVTHQTVNPNQSEENKETYYYYLLKLFKPWRNEKQLQHPGLNFYDTFNLENKNLPDMDKYHRQQTELSEQDEKTDNAIKERATHLEKTAEVEEEDGQSAFVGCMTDHVTTAMEELVTAQSVAAKYDSTDLEAKYGSLNVDQKRIVDKVFSAVCDGTEPIHLIVSGQGGSGKSRVISVLHQSISEAVKSTGLSVVVAAPTGLAAFSIGGTTIHRLLSLPVEHGKPADYSKLNQDQLKIIRATLKNLQLLIIDEVSMVSSLTLLFIHMRLTEIMCNDAYFGGISVVFFADFLQLPPVKGNQPFIPVTFLEAKQRIGSIASVDLWKVFSYEELTINMRQSADRQYADILADIRIGKVTDSAYKLLTERLITPGRRATVAEICQCYSNLVEAKECPLILLPRTSLCDEVNDAMLQKTGNQVYTLTAIDTLDTVVSKKLMSKVEKAYHKTDEDPTRTAGLEKVVRLSVGAKVMLKKNKDVEAGLVNGSVGTIVDFGLSATKTEINSISIQFKNIHNPVSIYRESCSFEVLKGIYYTRKQFPVMLAFAITIHKSQGLSLQSVIVDAGESTFGCGMVYVALSRVTSLSGLHLIDISRQKIKCDQKAVEEYNRLRSLYTPHLGSIPKEQNSVEPHPTNNKHRKRQTVVDSKAVPRKKQAKEKKPTTSAADLDVIITDEDNYSIYEHCSIASIDAEFQHQTCQRLNLTRDPETKEQKSTRTAVCCALEAHIQRQTGQKIYVQIFQIVGDGNCLFRALSKSVTGSQAQHLLFRSYTVNHMLDDSVTSSFEQFFQQKMCRRSPFLNYLGNMERPGVWGTEQEITAAASLLECSILCFSKCPDTGKFCLQHFTPHFATTPDCTDMCNHPSIYLINSTGCHYETAIVCLTSEE